MAKLQRIKRSNGSVVYSVNIPLEIIEELGWRKGDTLIVNLSEATNYEIIKGAIIIFRDGSDINEKEEQNHGA